MIILCSMCNKIIYIIKVIKYINDNNEMSIKFSYITVWFTALTCTTDIPQMLKLLIGWNPVTIYKSKFIDEWIHRCVPRNRIDQQPEFHSVQPPHAVVLRRIRFITFNSLATRLNILTNICLTMEFKSYAILYRVGFNTL